MKIINRKSRFGFTLPEAMAAIVILAMTVTAVTTVINRSVASASDTSRRIRAFQVAREHMETLLGLDSVAEQIEYGTTDDLIEWQDSVHAFYEPITMRMWVEAVCTAEYEDSKGEIQKVELTHWLTDLSAKQLTAMLENKAMKTLEEAAEYAGVSEETIEQWVDKGMPLTDDGYFLKPQLDLFRNSNGSPTPEQVAKVGNDPLTPQEPDTTPDTTPDNDDTTTSNDQKSKITGENKIDCSKYPEWRSFLEHFDLCL